MARKTVDSYGDVRDRITQAISIGVPLYNAGDHAACAQVCLRVRGSLCICTVLFSDLYGSLSLFIRVFFHSLVYRGRPCSVCAVCLQVRGYVTYRVRGSVL